MRSIHCRYQYVVRLLLFVNIFDYILAPVFISVVVWWSIKLNINVRTLSIFTNWIAAQNMPFCDSNEFHIQFFSFVFARYLREKSSSRQITHTHLYKDRHHHIQHPVAHKIGIRKINPHWEITKPYSRYTTNHIDRKGSYNNHHAENITDDSDDNSNNNHTKKKIWNKVEKWNPTVSKDTIYSIWI